MGEGSACVPDHKSEPSVRGDNEARRATDTTLLSPAAPSARNLIAVRNQGFGPDRGRETGSSSTVVHRSRKVKTRLTTGVAGNAAFSVSPPKRGRACKWEKKPGRLRKSAICRRRRPQCRPRLFSRAFQKDSRVWQLKHSIAVTSPSPASEPAASLARPLALSVLALDWYMTRLLNAGQPSQQLLPPWPLQTPPPGHEPASVGAAAAVARGGGGAACATVAELDGGGVGGWYAWLDEAAAATSPGGARSVAWCTSVEAHPCAGAPSAGLGRVVCAGVQGCWACLDELATGGDCVCALAADADVVAALGARRFFWYRPGGPLSVSTAARLRMGRVQVTHHRRCRWSCPRGRVARVAWTRCHTRCK